MFAITKYHIIFVSTFKQTNIMDNYLISKETVERLSINIYEASMIISTIPDEIINEEMKSRIDLILFISKNNMRILENLKQQEIVDPLDFHQMD